MNLLIAGSRTYADAAQIRAFVASLPGDTVLINGGARGVDTLAGEAATDRGLAVRVYAPKWKTYGRGAGVVRNAEMVAAADYVVCFWDNVSRGTADTIARAKRAGKLLAVFAVGERADWEDMKP